MTREEEEMQPRVRRGRGRPRYGEGYGTRLEVRLGPEEQTALDHMVIETGKTKSELIRKAITLYYQVKRNRW